MYRCQKCLLVSCYIICHLLKWNFNCCMSHQNKLDTECWFVVRLDIMSFYWRRIYNWCRYGKYISTVITYISQYQKHIAWMSRWLLVLHEAGIMIQCMALWSDLTVLQANDLKMERTGQRSHVSGMVSGALMVFRVAVSKLLNDFWFLKMRCKLCKLIQSHFHNKKSYWL